MHLSTLIAPALVAAVAAYPQVKSEARAEGGGAPSRTNCGFVPCTSFDHADQFVDVRPGSGNEFVAPGEHDIRGPCPGLNAAANHKFTSHTGVNSKEDTIFGLNKAFSLSHEFAAILFVFSVFNSGSLVDMAWSIGGPMKTNTVGGLLGQGLGLSNSHNHYEGDASTGRGDAYLHNGDAHSLSMANYRKLRAHAEKSGNFGMAEMRAHNVQAHEFSKAENPYAFFGPGFFVSPIAHEFVTNFMSNHTKENPNGYLPPHILDSFFAVKKHKDGSFEWMKGHDQIPLNWYKRPSSNPYGANSAFGDLAVTIAENPVIGEIGGNLGKKGDYAGLNIDDLTSGAFNAKDFTKGDQLACFGIQALVIGIPGAAKALAAKALPFTVFANKVLGGALNKATCPQLTEKNYKKNKFNKYPGFTYQPPRQPATPY